MTKFQTIERLQDIQLDHQWIDASTGIVVDQSGNPVTVDFTGRKYELIVRERIFSSLERFGRCLLAIVAIVCTLGTLYFSDSLKNLFQKKLTLLFGIKLQAKDLALELGRAGSLTEEMGIILLSHLTKSDLARCCAVSKSMQQFTDRDVIWNGMIMREMTLGKKMWAHLGDIGAEPSFSENLYDTFKKPCPFSAKKTIGQTHVLLLIPGFIQNQDISPAKIPFNLRNLIAINEIQRGNPNIHHDYRIRTPEEYREDPLNNSYWVLITKDFIIAKDRTSLNKDDQRALIAQIASKNKINYQHPYIMEHIAYTYILFNRMVYRPRNGYVALRRLNHINQETINV